MTSTMTDFSGRIFFHCSACGAPLTDDDFIDLGLRAPDSGEGRDEYCDAELLDSVRHADCARARKAG